MPNDLKTRPEDGAMALFGGVITDVHRLITQQLALFRHEIQGDFNRLHPAGLLVAAGLVFVTVGSVSLCGMLAHLAARILPGLPLWACYAAVGIPVTALGAALCLAGRQRLKGLNAAAVAPGLEREESTDG